MKNGIHQQEVFLKPGEMLLAKEPTIATTVLGSCVSITLFHQKTKMGAICHAVLPTGDINDPGKYVDQAVSHMVNHFGTLKIRPVELVAKLFGGADMFHMEDPTRRNRTVGTQNVSTAIRCLRDVGLVAVASDTGGQRGRKLVFYTYTGEVFIKKVRKDPPKVYNF